MNKNEYIRPEAEVLHLPVACNILVSFSIESGLAEFEEGEEL